MDQPAEVPPTEALGSSRGDEKHLFDHAFVQHVFHAPEVSLRPVNVAEQKFRNWTTGRYARAAILRRVPMSDSATSKSSVAATG